jgi:SagB-type dehydrogenase family enzyme
VNPLRAYHEATKHSPASVQSSRFTLDWPNKPLAFKMYTTLPPIALPLTFAASAPPALDAIAGTIPAPVSESPLSLETLARLCYFANGITRVLQRHGQRMPFRAAACTGALYHIELYLVCADLPDLAAGVYHYGAHDNALRLLRRGDFRAVLNSAAGEETSIAQAPVVMVMTSTFWRNAWKYQARAYRHSFWDTGTIVANLLSVAAANSLQASLVVGFADAPVNALLDIDPAQEAAVCLVSLGPGGNVPTALTHKPPPTEPLRLPSEPLSATQVEYPQIAEAHTASSLASGPAASAWRAAASRREAPRHTHIEKRSGGPHESIEQVILRRGSARRFASDPIDLDQLMDILTAATAPIPSDVQGKLTQPYLIVNAVDGLASGTYVFHRQPGPRLELLQTGDFRHQAALLDLGQDLAGQAAVNVYWLADLNVVLNQLGGRGYRAAQLEAAIEGGKLYLAAYALGLGATGLTFFDDDVTNFFAPHAAGKSVMFLEAVGHSAKRRV